MSSGQPSSPFTQFLGYRLRVQPFTTKPVAQCQEFAAQRSLRLPGRTIQFGQFLRHGGPDKLTAVFPGRDAAQI